MAQATIAGKGLEGVTATTSAISSIIGSTLTYRGIDINELADHSTFEEVAYLLWYGELPRQDQLDRFKQELIAHREISTETIDFIRQFPRDANSMVSLRTAVSVLAFADPLASDMSAEANHRKAVALRAQFPVLVAAIHRLRCGKEPVSPDPNLGEAANFLYMLNGDQPSDSRARIMDIALILHADHELNASTFAARVAASTLSDMHSAIVAAICTLKGPLHGGANEAVMKTLESIGSVDAVPAFLRGSLERKDKIMGFGHRVYKEGDPRARWLKRLSSQLADETGDRKWYEMSELMEQEMKADKGLLPNVDFYSASVYTYMGVPRELFTPIFAVSRASGWIAHVLEQYENNRLIRPRAEYVGPAARGYIPMSER